MSLRNAKVITIEIEEVPEGFVRPYIEKVKPKLQKLAFLTEREPIPMQESTFTRDVYPMQRFAYGTQWEEFYIRDKDKTAFEQLIEFYIKSERERIFEQIREFIWGSETPNVAIENIRSYIINK